MSKLPKAPLLEVIFEMKWDITNKNDVVDFQYIHGDLYSKLKDKYPFRENLLPPEVPFEVVKGMPVFRFRKEVNGYPLVQVGPGLFTFNTNDDNYFWEEFKIEIKNTLSSFTDIYPKLNELNLIPTLTYIDFLEFHPDKKNIMEFINNYLGMSFEQRFIKQDNANIKDINLTLNYQIDDNILSLNLRNGAHNNKNGLVLQTKIIGERNIFSSEHLIGWLDSTHEICSNTFKKITKGELYNSFK